MNENEKMAVVLLGHGSRVAGAGESMQKVADRLREKYGFSIVETCYMSRLGPHFDQAMENCVEQGADKVLVIPYFLHIGMHLLVDIPEMLQENARKFPKVKVVLGKNLGHDETLVDLVHKRIYESIDFNNVLEIELPDRNKYPVPPGQEEFVPMTPEQAENYRKKHDHDQHHH